MDAKVFLKNGLLDFGISNSGLTEDHGLETAVILSLFLHARAKDEDDIEDKRGYWADLFTDAPEDRIGSRLWLLAREKMQPDLESRAESYALEALEWMVDDGVAKKIEVTARRFGKDRLSLFIVIIKPDSQVEKFEYRNIWDYVQAA